MPLTKVTAATAAELCVFDLEDPAGTAVNGVWTGNLPPDALVLATDDANWARIKDVPPEPARLVDFLDFYDPEESTQTFIDRLKAL